MWVYGLGFRGCVWYLGGGLRKLWGDLWLLVGRVSGSGCGLCSPPV